MQPQDAVTIRRFASAAEEVDAVADWYVELLVSMQAPEQMRPVGIDIGKPTYPGSRFRVQAHRQEFACFYGHAVDASGLVGHFELLGFRRDGKLGEVVCSIKVTSDAVLFEDGTGIHQFLTSQDQYNQVRSQTCYRLMQSIQKHLPRI